MRVLLLPIAVLLLLTLTSPLFLEPSAEAPGAGDPGPAFQSQPEGFTEVVANRTRHSKLFVSDADPDLFRIVVSTAPVHWLNGSVFEDINSTLVASSADVPTLGTADLEVTEDDFEWFALSTLNQIPLLLFRNKTTPDTFVNFNPDALQYRNDLNDVSIVAQPNIGVLGQVTGPTLLWPDGYGTGRNLSVSLGPGQMRKELLLESAPPAPPQFILDGGNPVLELLFFFASGNGPDAPDVRVDGVLWDQASTRDTGQEVVFELAGAPLFVFRVPFASDSGGNETQGTMQLSKTGPTLKVGVRIPLGFLENATYPVLIDPTVDLQVGAGADDTDTETGSWSNSRTSPDCPGRDNSAGSTPCDASFRWTSVAVPQGATITAATFEPHTFPSGDDGPNVRTNIYLEAADSASAPSSLADFNGRTRTTAFTAWDGQSFADAFTVSPDISAVVDEVTSRLGWSSGNSVQVFWDDDGSPAPDSHYEHRTFDFGSGDGAKLHITFTTPAPERFGVFSDAACDELAISTDADCWSGTSGGAGGAGVPGFGDNVTLDTNTGTFARMDANLTVANVTWANHPFDFTTGGFVLQANGSWSQDSGFLNIDGPGLAPGGVVVLGDFTLFDSGFVLFDESNGFVRIGGDLLFDDEAYVDVSGTFTDALISVAGNYTALSVDAGNWDSTNLEVRLNGTADQTINTTTDADLDLLVLRNGTKLLETDYRGVVLRADAGDVNLTISNGQTVTLGPSGRIENLTLTSDVSGSPYNLTRSGANIRANNSDFQDANGLFVDAATEAGNTDSGNNVNVTFRGIAPLTFLNVTWEQGAPGPEARNPQYVFFQPSFGATPVPRVQVVPTVDPFDVFVTLHTADNVTLEICTSDAFNELGFTFDGLTPNRVYRLLRNGVEILNTTTDGAGTWNAATSGLSGTWDECPTDVLNLLGVDFPPAVVTVSASATATQAVLRGNLASLGSPTPAGNFTVFFEWGFSVELGFNTTGVEVNATGQFTALIGDLEPGTTYFFRAVVQWNPEAFGDVESFTTQFPSFLERPLTVVAVVISLLAILLCALGLRTEQRSFLVLCGIATILASVVWVLALLELPAVGFGLVAMVGTLIFALGLIIFFVGALGKRGR